MKKLFILLFSCMMLVACGGSKSNGGNGIIGGGGNNGGNGGGGIFSQTTSNGGGGGQGTNNQFPEQQLLNFLKNNNISVGNVPAQLDANRYEYGDTSYYGYPAYEIVGYVSNETAANNALSNFYNVCVNNNYQVDKVTQNDLTFYGATSSNQQLAIMFMTGQDNNGWALDAVYIATGQGQGGNTSQQGGVTSQSTNNGYPESELKAFLKKYGYSGQVPVWAGGANYEYEETTMYGLPAFGIAAYVNNQNALNTATNELYNGCTKLGFQVTSQTQDGIDVYIAVENTDKLAVMFYPYSSNGMYGLVTLYIVNTSGN